MKTAIKLYYNYLKALFFRLKSSFKRNRGKAPEVYILWDSIGDGRPVGVFLDECLVKKLVHLNPHYFRYYKCNLNFPDKKALEWLEPEQKKLLIEICKPFHKATFKKPDKI
jgi:hypothetical protein